MINSLSDNQTQEQMHVDKQNLRLSLAIIATFLFTIVGLISSYLFIRQNNFTKQNDLTIAQKTYGDQLETQEITDSRFASSGRVAYRSGGGFNDGGDIWTSYVDGSGKKKITKSKHIDVVYSWSPDSKYILASTNEMISGNGVNSNYVVINSETGEEVKTSIVRGETGQGVSDFVWTKDNEINYIDEDVMYSVVVGGERKELWRVPEEKELNAIEYHLDKEARKIAFDTSGPDFPDYFINVFSYDIEKNIKTQITTGGAAYILGWMGDLIIYQQRDALWSSSFDGKTKRKLADLKGYYISNSSISTDGSKILYLADDFSDSSLPESKLFIFDIKNQEITELNKLTGNSFSGNISLSRDAENGSYMLSGANPMLFAINFKDQKKFELCESSCYYSAWQN